MAIGNFTLTGHFDTLSGFPATGTVRIDGNPQIITDSSGNKVRVGPRTVVLNGTGDFSVTLPSDSTSGNSTSIAFKVTPKLTGLAIVPPTNFYARPIGSTVDLKTISSVPVVELGNAPTGPQGATGATGPQGPQGLPGVNGVANDTATAGYFTTPGTATQTAADARYARHDQRVVVTAPTRAAFIAALDAAKAKGPGTIVYAPDYGTPYDLGNGVSLSGYSCQLQGAGAAGAADSANPSGTVFKASTQTGPVLDFTGWSIPTPAFTGRVRHGGFHVRGSGVADPTKVRSGIKIASMSSATFHDIAVSNTGGPCIEGASTPGNALYLCAFERITLNTPVGAKANDVAYMRLDEPNGTVFRNIGLRSVLTSGDVGVSGAIVITSNSQYPADMVDFDATWFENLHVPTNGTLFAIQTIRSRFTGTQFFDCLKEVGATGTSCYRVTPPAVSDWGSNEIHGVIPGTDAANPTTIDMGVDLRQSRNLISGIKGYRDSNVVLAAGVVDNHIDLGGGEPAAIGPAVVNNSGNSTNTVNDAFLKVFAFSPPPVSSVRKFIAGRYYGAANHGLPTTIANGAGLVTLVPFWVETSMTVAAISCEVTTGAASSTVRLGVYQSDSSDMPSAVVLDAGTVDSSTVGVKEITGLSTVLAPGLYWLAAACLGGAPALRTIGSSALAPVAATSFVGGGATIGINTYYDTGITSTLKPWTSTAAASQGYKVMVKAG